MINDTQNTEHQDDPGKSSQPPPLSRLELIWQVVVFQFKLALDGLRDLLLVPISLLAAVAGLLTDSTNPGKYYQAVLNFGRKTEQWINLFGYRKKQGTADEMLQPIQDQLMQHAQRHPGIQKAGQSVSDSLDKSAASLSPLANKVKSQINQPKDSAIKDDLKGDGLKGD